MEASKIYIKPLHKSFYVRHTNKMMKMSYQFQLLMSKMGTIAESNDPEDQVNLAMEYSDALVDFPHRVLKLNDKQAEKLDDQDQDVLQNIAVELALTIQGLPKHEIKKTLDNMNEAINDGEDPKKSDK